MHPLQILSDTVAWAGKNIAYNLGFIPDDKLSWKAAPEAKSALEICEEVVYVLSSFGAMLKGEAPGEKTTFSTREAAQSALESQSATYAKTLVSLSESDLEGEMQLPFGPMPKMRAVMLPVYDALHHHGQIAFIQTLLGDTTSHFYEMGS